MVTFIQLLITLTTHFFSSFLSFYIIDYIDHMDHLVDLCQARHILISLC